MDLLLSLLIIVAEKPRDPRRPAGARSPITFYADRKIWAAVQLRRGPNVVGPWGLLAVLRRHDQVLRQGADDSGRRQQGRVPARAAGDFGAGAGRLGGDPGQGRLGGRQSQCRRALYFRHFVARRLWHHHGRLGVELEISLPRRPALGGANGVLRSLDRLRHHHRPALRGLAEPQRHRPCAGHANGACSAGTGCRCSRCS